MDTILKEAFGPAPLIGDIQKYWDDYQSFHPHLHIYIEVSGSTDDLWHVAQAVPIDLREAMQADICIYGSGRTDTYLSLYWYDDWGTENKDFSILFRNLFEMAETHRCVVEKIRYDFSYRDKEVGYVIAMTESAYRRDHAEEPTKH